MCVAAEVSHGTLLDRPCFLRASPLERRTCAGCKTRPEAAAGMGHPILAGPAPTFARPSAVRFRHRQQASRVRRRQGSHRDIVAGGRIRNRAMVVQQKTKRPVQFELVEPARKTLIAWLERRGGTSGDYVFPSRNDYMGHMSTRQYARLVREWVTGIGLQAEDYARARSAKRRRRSSTRRLAICARCRSCLATPRSRAPSATSVLMWRTRWSWRNVRRFDQGSAAFTTQWPRSTAWITATQSNYGRELTSAF